MTNYDVIEIKLTPRVCSMTGNYSTSHGIVLPAWSLVLSLTVVLLTIVVGLMLNLVMTFIILIKKHLRNYMNVYFINLAVCDVIICCVTLLMRLAFLLTNEPFSHSTYRVDLFFQCLVDMARMFLLVGVSFERHQAIAAPFKKGNSAKWRTIAGCVASWTVAVVLAVISATFYENSLSHVFTGRSIKESVNTEMFLILPLTFVCLVIIIICYLAMLRFLYQHGNKMSSRVKKTGKVSPEPTTVAKAIDVNTSSVAKDVDLIPTTVAKDVDLKPATVAKDVHLISTTVDKDVDLISTTFAKDVHLKPTTVAKTMDLIQTTVAKDVDLISTTVSKALDPKTSTVAKYDDLITTKVAKDVDLIPTTAAKDVDLKPATVAKDVDLKPTTVAKAMDLIPTKVAMAVKLIPTTVAKDVDLKPTTVAKDVDFKPATVAKAVDLIPTTVAKDVGLKPGTVTMAVDLISTTVAKAVDLIPTTVAMAVDLIPTTIGKDVDLKPTTVAKTVDLTQTNLPTSTTDNTSNASATDNTSVTYTSIYTAATANTSTRCNTNTTGATANTSATCNTSATATTNTAATDKKVVSVYGMDGSVRQQTIKDSHNISGSVCVYDSKNRMAGKRRVEMRAAKRIGVVMGTFLLLWLPFPVSVLVCRNVAGGEGGCRSWLILLATVSSFTAITNPLLYILTNKQLKSAVLKFLPDKLKSCGNKLK